MASHLQETENLIASLTERIALLENDRNLASVDPYSVGDRVEVLNYTHCDERFGIVMLFRSGQVYFVFEGSRRWTWRSQHNVQLVVGN